jgi:formyltetrahydrofolate synthetase
MVYKTDSEIAQETTMQPIREVATEPGIDGKYVELYEQRRFQPLSLRPVKMYKYFYKDIKLIADGIYVIHAFLAP